MLYAPGTTAGSTWKVATLESISPSAGSNDSVMPWGSTLEVPSFTVPLAKARERRIETVTDLLSPGRSARLSSDKRKANSLAGASGVDCAITATAKKRKKRVDVVFITVCFVLERNAHRPVNR